MPEILHVRRNVSAVRKETSEPASGPGGRTGVFGSVPSRRETGPQRFMAGPTARRRRLLVRSVKALVVVTSPWLLAAFVLLPAL